jgi:hypothetical protein
VQPSPLSNPEFTIKDRKEAYVVNDARIIDSEFHHLLGSAIVLGSYGGSFYCTGCHMHHIGHILSTTAYGIFLGEASTMNDDRTEAVPMTSF